MPSAKSDERTRAEQIYRESDGSIKLVDIAERLGVSPSKVRKWKSLDGWDKKDQQPQGKPKKKQVERSTSNKGNAPPADAPKRKRGGQPGNRNGKGAPPGNIRPATHGAYMKFYESVLSDEEREAYQHLIDQGERDRLNALYAQHQMTERKLMSQINDILNGAESITHKTVSTVEPTGTKGADGREITKVVKISQEQVSRKDLLRNFTDALTRVRAEMRRTADSLRQLGETEAKVKALNSGDDEIASLVEAINSAWEEGKDGDD